MNPVNFQTVPTLAKFGVCWSFFWRAIVITIGSTIGGAVLGAAVGAVAAIAGLPREASPVAGGIVGLCVGFGFIYLYVLWLLSSRVGRFRLQLVAAES